MQRVAKYTCLAWFGGSCYVTFEVFWRGRSHWTMFVLAAILFVLIGLLNEIWTSWRLFPQAVAGAIIATAAELVTGCIVNLWLGWGIWDTRICLATCWGRSARSLRFYGWH